MQLTTFDNDAALATFTRARQILEDAYGETHPSLGALHVNLGVIAIFQGRRAEAVQEFLRALSIDERHLPANHPAIASCLRELGEGQMYSGDLMAALRTSERSLEVHLAAHGAGHARVSVALANLGLVLLRTGDQVAAEAAFTRALTEFRGAADEPELGRAYAGRGALRLAQGRVEEALADLEAGLDRLQRNPNAAPFHVAEVQFALARALSRGGGNASRARSMAADAQKNFAVVGPGFQVEEAEVKTWVAQLPSG